MRVQIDGVEVETRFDREGVITSIPGSSKPFVVPWQVILLLLMMGLFFGGTQSRVVDITMEGGNGTAH